MRKLNLLKRLLWLNRNSYTKTPVTIEAIKVPRRANVMIAPKFEKKGFCQGKYRG